MREKVDSHQYSHNVFPILINDKKDAACQLFYKIHWHDKMRKKYFLSVYGFGQQSIYP